MSGDVIAPLPIGIPRRALNTLIDADAGCPTTATEAIATLTNDRTLGYLKRSGKRVTKAAHRIAKAITEAANNATAAAAACAAAPSSKASVAASSSSSRVSILVCASLEQAQLGIAAAAVDHSVIILVDSCTEAQCASHEAAVSALRGSMAPVPEPIPEYQPFVRLPGARNLGKKKAEKYDKKLSRKLAEKRALLPAAEPQPLPRLTLRAATAVGSSESAALSASSVVVALHVPADRLLPKQASGKQASASGLSAWVAACCQGANTGSVLFVAASDEQAKQIGDAVATLASPPANADAAATPLKLHHLAVEGDASTSLLIALLKSATGTRRRIVVHVASARSVEFFVDLIDTLAIECPKMFADTASSGADDAALGDDSGSGDTVAAFDAVPASEAVVLLTPSPAVPRTAQVHLWFDGVSLHPFLTHLRAIQNTTPNCTCILLSPPAWHSNVVKAIRAASSVPIELKAMKPPSAGSVVMTADTVRMQVGKLFTLQVKAFEAYRALMRHYATSCLPVSVFDVTRLDLDQQAAEFGLSEAPLLDLRTKETPFRPKEDVLRVANEANRKKKRSRNAALVAEAEAQREADRQD